MLKDFKPKINVVEKRWAWVLPFTFKLRWMNIWCKTRSRKEVGFMWALWNKAIAVNTWRAKVDNLIKLAHCAIMKKNPRYINFGSVIMHNGLGCTHKTLWVRFWECYHAQRAWVYTQDIVGEILGVFIMHNGLGSTHKTLWVSLPTIISHHGWLPP
jgi:hypothetical protein